MQALEALTRDARALALGEPVQLSAPETEVARQMQICTLQALNWLKHAAGGDLGRIDGILQLKCYVACTAEFDGISRIADSATRVFVTAFGDAGKHPRSVLGMMRLPQDAPVMIDLIAGLKG